MAYFVDAAAGVTPKWQANGLRVAQLGALWGVASRFTIGTGPFQVVLPTGSGKTAVMTALPFAVPTTRVLVVAPSRLVRDQVVDEFRTLACFARREAPTWIFLHRVSCASTIAWPTGRPRLAQTLWLVRHLF